MVEPGEAFPDAARREAREETGLDLLIGDLVACVDRADLVMMVFTGHVVGGTLRPAAEEIAELRWMGLDDLERLSVFDLARSLGRSLLTGTAIPGLSQTSISWPDGGSRRGQLPGVLQRAGSAVPGQSFKA